MEVQFYPVVVDGARDGQLKLVQGVLHGRRKVRLHEKVHAFGGEGLR